MEHTTCDCSAPSRQHVADCLSQEKLPLDRILEAGSKLSSLLSETSQCERCIRTKSISKWFIQATIRLICFYEAATNQTLPDRDIAGFGLTSSPHGQQLAWPTSPSPEMKLGGLSINEVEGRLLVKLALIEACSDLSDKIQVWKVAAEESWEATEQAYRGHYNDQILGRCLELLAKLVGLLQLDGPVVT